MSEEWGGEERRQSRGCCPSHAEMVKRQEDLLIEHSSHQSESKTMKWIIGLSIPLLISVMGYMVSTGTDQLQSISGDMKEVKTMIVNSQVRSAVLEQRMNSLEERFRQIDPRGGR